MRPSLLTDFVCGCGAAVVLPEEGVDQAQLGEAVLAKAEIKRTGDACRRDTCIGLTITRSKKLFQKTKIRTLLQEKFCT